MKIVAIIIIVFISHHCCAQSKITTEQEARAFFANANDEQVTTITITEEDVGLYELYSKRNPGDILFTGNDVYQVVGPKKITIYSCFAISFDKEKQGVKEVEKLQKTIMAKYKFGTSIEELAALYALPENFNEIEINYNDMPEGPFKTALGEHKPGEIFIMEISQPHSYVMTITSPPVHKKVIIVKQAASLQSEP